MKDHKFSIVETGLLAFGFMVVLGGLVSAQDSTDPTDSLLVTLTGFAVIIISKLCQIARLLNR